MTIADEMTGAITTTDHDPGGMLHTAQNLIQLADRVIELATLQRLQLLVARQHHRHHHRTHAHIMHTTM
jgi:hypothetical protein